MAIEFSIVSGALPPGLIGTTVGDSFVISGTPTTAGNFTFRLRAERENGTFVEKDYTLNALAIAAGSLPSANVGQPYSQTPTLVGFPAGDLTWAATGLPDGLSINPDTGEISGTPTSQGNFSFNVTASDSLGCTAQVEGGGTVDIEVVEEGECPEETGTATTIDLLVDTGVNYGLATPFIQNGVPFPGSDPDSVEFVANAARGRYRISYVNGAFFAGTGIGTCPETWRVQSYTISYSGGPDSLQSVTCISHPGDVGSQAEVEAVMAGYSLVVNQFSAGPISVDVGSIPDVTSGSPDPTWQLEQLQEQTAQLARVRIQNFANVLLELDPCAGCADSGLTAWDGTFPAFSAPSFTITYGNIDVASLNRSLNGKRLSQVRIQNMSFHPTSPTGAGWILSIRCDVDGFDSLLVWQGIKGVGNTAAGRYYRYDVNSPCSAGPECLVCEEY